MTGLRLRYYAQKALEELDWIDQHVTARNIQSVGKVETHIDGLRQLLLRLAGASTDVEAYDSSDDSEPEEPSK